MAELLVPDNVFTDISTDFDQNPANDDVIRLRDIESIKRSIRNIILTNKGERPFNFNFGSGVRDFLFETVSPFVLQVLRLELEQNIQQHEPRATNVRAEVYGRMDANELVADIKFVPINTTQVVTLNIILERKR